MNTKKSLNLSGFIAANPMSKYSDCAWSEAACNNNLGTAATNYLTAGELNLMSRFSLNSSLALHSATDSDATSSSTSSSSATNNSSNSLSASPAAAERDTRPNKPTHQASNHLLELQKEIKEEEEEIFADINSLINSRSNLYSTLVDEDDGVNLDDDTIENHNTFNHINHQNHNHQQHHNHNHTNNNIHLRGYHNRTDENIFTTDSDDLNDYQSHSADDTAVQEYQDESGGGGSGSGSDDRELHQFQINEAGVEHETVGFMHHDQDDQYLREQIEEEHQENDPQYMEEHAFASDHQADQQNYQTIQAVIQQVTSNLPKPCVFFLEGNCRRSDCKYSHDLSTITCKYWIEGFCFKGELCPFLHSYTPPSDSQDPNFLDEDGLKSLVRKQLNPTFVIESEADFPSLPLDAPANALNDSTKSSINADIIATSIKNQILSSNPAVVFKTVKKKRKRG